MTALTVAALFGEVDAVHALLKAGANSTAKVRQIEFDWGKNGQKMTVAHSFVNQILVDGRTALMVAASNGNIEVLRDLLRADAALEAIDQVCKIVSDYIIQ